MAGKKGQDLGVIAEEKFFRNFVRDIKRNGIGYIKSEKVALKLKQADPDIQVVWNKEDRSYTAYYNK